MSTPASLIGESLGHYRVIEKIGAGGMGEVYRARDERLGRDVAIKVLHSASAQDQDRLRRFEQEARSAAALNHPNILAVYDVGIHDGSPFLVTELLQGESLRHRLIAGQIPLRQALEYAVQTAQGLSVAHEKGIVHRDLKPENLYLTREGMIKILDFGLAKLVNTDSSIFGMADAANPTLTASGVIVGTTGYMSPEQIRGKTLDHRSDIFSFGAILYELISGKRAFQGETGADTMTAVLLDDPPSLLIENGDLPPALEDIVRRCLEKDPENRFQSTRDLVFALSTNASGTYRASSMRLRGARTSTARKYLPSLLGGIAVVATIAALWLWQAASVTGSPVYRRLSFERGTVFSARFSPDQGSVVYDAAWTGMPNRVFTTPADSPAARAMDVDNAHFLAVSAGGEMALAVKGSANAHAVHLGGMLARAPLAGGTPRELLEDVRWADWSPNGELAVVHHALGHSRMEFPIGKVLYETTGWISHIRFSPDGQRIAFLNHPSWSDDRGTVDVIDLKGDRKTLSSGWDSEEGLAWRPDGKEIWFTAVETGYNRALHAVTLDGKQRTVLQVPGGLTIQDIARDGRVLITFDNERLAMEGMSTDKADDRRNLSWFDWTIAKEITDDGKTVFFEESSEPAGLHYSVALRDANGSAPTRLGDGSAGGLSPDRKWAIAIYVGTPERIRLLPTGAGQARELPVGNIEHYQNGAAHFLPDGKHIVFNASEAKKAMRSYVQNIDSGDPKPITPEGTIAILPSPDGRSVLGTDVERRIVTVTLADGTVTLVSGLEANLLPVRWSSDPKTVFVCECQTLPARVYRVNVENGKRELLREVTPADRDGAVFVRAMAMTPDAKHIVYSYYRMVSVLYTVTGLK